jgi:hypothetical protein
MLSGVKQLNPIKNRIIILFLLLFVGFFPSSHSLYGKDAVRKRDLKNVTSSIGKKSQELSYYLYISDFIDSFIEIPTSNLASTTLTLESSYLAGRAAVYDKKNKKVGTCSASFLNMQNEDGIYTDISNFLSIDNGLIVSWFTPTKLVNLLEDSLVNSMVTECMVVATTKIGINPFYGQSFNLIVSSDGEKIYFEFTRTGTIF